MVCPLTRRARGGRSGTICEGAEALAHPIGRLTLPLALLAGLQACQDPAARAAPKAPERPVLVARAAYAAHTPERSFVAAIRPRVESDLGFRVPGKVARRLVQVGDAVRAGQPLAVLDETDLRLQQEQAEAERAAASAALAQVEGDLQRAATLRSQGWTAEAALDRLKAQVEEARGRRARAERAAELAANAVSYAVLAADADGVVTAAPTEPGQVLAAGQPAIRLARLDEREAVVAVPENLVGGLKEAEAHATLWSDPSRRYAARLRELSPSADPSTRTYAARFALPGADDAVRLGMTATLSISRPGAGRVARLPLSALYNAGSGPAVWTVRADGALELKPVTVQGYEAREVLVSGGVDEGDQVVALGVQKLDPGQRVRIVEALRY